MPFLPRSEIAQAADELLLRGLGTAADEIPVDLDALVFDHLCEHEGLVFIEDEVLAGNGLDEVLGRTELVAGRIVVCAALKLRDLRRYRFTVAHELGHWVLHRPLVLVDREQPELFSADTVYVTTANSLLAGVRGAPPEEWQANYFASHILLPRRALRREFEARYGDGVSVTPIGVSLREYSRQLARTPRASQESLADAFGASTEATAIALEDAGLSVAEPTLL